MNRVFGLVGTSFGLIALYLLLTNSRGAGSLISNLSRGYVQVVKALQGR